MPDQAGTVRLLHWTIRTSWILMLTLGACRDEAGPIGPAPVIADDLVVAVVAVESVDLSDLTDRLFPALDDESRANELQRAVDELTSAFRARDYSRARNALAQIRALVGSSEFHPATRALVTRALDGADTTIERAMPGTAH